MKDLSSLAHVLFAMGRDSGCLGFGRRLAVVTTAFQRRPVTSKGRVASLAGE